MPAIKYSVPFIGKEEKMSVRDAVTSGRIQGDGTICKQAEKALCGIMGARKAFLTTSGTHALELALMALGVKEGDEVICPSFTFVSTANAIIRQGARPVFAEIEPDTLNLDIDDVERRITKRTRAVIPVHYAGFSCDIARLRRLASDKGIRVIEDAAQSIGARYDGRHLGTFGDFGCLSFHSTKNITCGEGGAIIVNRKALDDRIQVIREKGTNRFLFMQGKICKYTWIDVGSSFVISDVLAAMLLAQLKRLPSVSEKRRRLFNIYLSGLKRLEDDGYIALPHPDDKRSCGNGHIFWILVNRDISRKRLIERLRSKGIQCTHHYIPLHSSPFGMKRLGYKKKDFPVTEDVARRLVRLPLHPYMTAKQVRYVIDELTRSLCRHCEPRRGEASSYKRLLRRSAPRNDKGAA
ncbi:dTDP-4-amino-4,6-dideoxygalactose transaminase [Candidatus Omnitrophota bacterium]